MMLDIINAYERLAESAADLRSDKPMVPEVPVGDMQCRGRPATLLQTEGSRITYSLYGGLQAPH